MTLVHVSQGDLEKAVETVDWGSCSQSISCSLILHSCFYNSIEQMNTPESSYAGHPLQWSSEAAKPAILCARMFHKDRISGLIHREAKHSILYILLQDGGGILKQPFKKKFQSLFFTFLGLGQTSDPSRVE